MFDKDKIVDSPISDQGQIYKIESDDIFDDCDEISQKSNFQTKKIADNELKLPNGKIIVFNDEQYEGINKIRQWLKSNKTFFTLSGAAGTGKSTLIKKVLDEYKYGIIVSAPTHKAKNVLERTTSREGKTLHSLLGLRPDVELADFAPNFPEFAPIALPQITDYRLCVIDECSMINQPLYELIKTKVNGSHTKVLFMGDSGQLPPINEVLSQAFNSTLNEFYHLSKVERQEDTNPLLLLYDDMRSNLDVNGGGFKRISKMNKEGEGVVFTLDKKEFRKAVLDKFLSNEYKENSDYCKGLAWRNDTVMQSNKIVRDAIFGPDADTIEIGDVLMGYRTVSNERQTYNIIENSVDYNVVGKSEKTTNGYDISGYNVKLRTEVDNCKYKVENVFIVDVNDEENIFKYLDMHDYYMQAAKMNKKLWKNYYTFRRNNLLMKTIEKDRNGQYRNSRDVVKMDLYYSFWITIHKSQGSTFKHVVINEQDILCNRNLVERNKLSYVAYSRPEKSAIVLTTRLDNE